MILVRKKLNFLDIFSIPGYDVMVLISLLGLMIVLISKKKYAKN